MLKDKPLSLEIISTLAVSIMLHLGIVGTLVFWSNFSGKKESRANNKLDFMWVSPVNVSELRSYEKKLPPPIVRPPAPKVKKVEKAKIIETKSPKPIERKEEKVKERPVDNARETIAKALSDMNSELEQKMPKANNYNREDFERPRLGGTGGSGVPDSMETYRYKTEVISILRRNWYIINRSVLKSLRDPLVKITIKIDSEGNIISNRLEKNSGNSYYDNSVLRAIEKSDPLPPPPDSLQREVSEEGLEIDFIPPSD